MTVRLRAARAEDADALAGMLRSLSPAAAFHRFVAGLGEPKPGLLRALLARGHDRGAWLAVDEDDVGEFVVGHACWRLAPTGVVDLGVVVADPWQRRGLGRRLLVAAVLEAATAGGTRLHLDVHPENRRVVRLLRDRLPGAVVTDADGFVQFDGPLAGAMPSRAGQAVPSPGTMERSTSQVDSSSTVPV